MFWIDKLKGSEQSQGQVIFFEIRLWGTIGQKKTVYHVSTTTYHEIFNFDDKAAICSGQK